MEDRNFAGSDYNPILEAEKQIISICLVGSERTPIIIEELEPHFFSVKRHEIIFQSIKYIYHKEGSIDVIMVTNRISENDQLNRVGGTKYIYDIYDSYIESENWKYFLDIVVNSFQRREIRSIAEDVKNWAVDESKPIAEVTEDLITRISSVCKSDSRINSIYVRDINPFEVERDNSFLSTGFLELDSILKLGKGRFIVLASRPGIGKSSLILNLASNIAKIYPETYQLLFSLEMSSIENYRRLVSIKSGVSFLSIKKSQVKIEQIAKGFHAVNGMRLILNDAHGLDILGIKREVRLVKLKHPELEIVFVDYLQLVASDKGANREQEVSSVSRHLKLLAIELDIAVVACSQLSRQPELRANKRPILSDLRESGGIENDADSVILMYRPSVYDDDEDESLTEVIVAKNRNGSLGTVELDFIPKALKFENRNPSPIY